MPFKEGGRSKRITAIYGGSRGHGKKVWGYGYDEIAAAAGIQPETVRVAVSRGQLNPSDLSSVAEFVLHHRGNGKQK